MGGEPRQIADIRVYTYAFPNEYRSTMKITLLVTSTVLMLTLNVKLGAQDIVWRPIEGPDEHSIGGSFFVSSQGLILAHYNDDSRDERALLASVDQGRSWRDLTQQFGEEFVPPANRLAAFAEDSRGQLYLVTGGGMYVSADGGESWEPMPTEGIALTFFPFITAMGIDERDNMYLGTNQHLNFFSSDAGNSWEELVLESPGYAPREAADFGSLKSGEFLVATITGQGLFRSSDHGQSWSEWLLPARYGGEYDSKKHLCINSRDQIIVADNNGGVFFNDGTSRFWELRNPAGLEVINVSALVCDSRDHLMAIFRVDGDSPARSHFYFSTDNGRNWNIAEDGIPPEHKAWAFVCTAGDVFYANVNGRLYHTQRPTNVEEERAEVLSSVRLYPNPADEHLRIESTSALNGPVKLRDLTGRLVMSIELRHSNHARLALSTLAAGQYYLHLSTATGNVVKMVTVRR